MKRRFLTCVLAVVLFLSCASPSMNIVAAEVEQKSITVDFHGKNYSQIVYEDATGTIFVPITMLRQFGGMSYTTDDSQYTFYYSSEADRYTAPLAGARRIFIDKSGETGKVVCYTSSSNYTTIENITFSKAQTINKKLYLPLEEFLPLFDAKVEITKDGILHIYRNPVPLYRALYSHNLDLWVFDREEFLFDEGVIATGMILDSVLELRFDRLDIITNSGAIKDYSDIFKTLLTDNEIYLSAFDQKETPVDKALGLLAGSAGDLDDAVGGVKDILKLAEYMSTSPLHDTYKEFSDSVKQFGEDADLIEGAIKVIEYADAYYNQVDDHRNMLMAVYDGELTPAGVAAYEVYNLYGAEVGSKVKSAVKSALLDYTTKELSSVIAKGVGLTPYKIAFSAVKLVLPDAVGELSDAADLYYIDKVAQDAYDAATQRLNNIKFDKASLENLRLSLIMTLVASKHGYETYISDDEEEIDSINKWLEELYLAADSVECVSKGYYASKKAELSKAVAYVHPVGGGNTSYPTEPSQGPTEPSEEPTENPDDTISGICGDNLTWTFADGILTITGTGNMYDFDSESDQPWFIHRDKIASVVVNNGITSVGINAFEDCSNLASVTLSSSVTIIGKRAFSGCGKLQNITIPGGVTAIGDLAFSNCHSLMNISIPESLRVINDFLFRGCKSLKSITIPKGVTTIGDYAFRDCVSLVDVFYESSETDWKEIDIGSNNDDLFNATIHYGWGSSSGDDTTEDRTIDYAMESAVGTTYIFENTGKETSYVTAKGSIASNVRADWILVESDGTVRSHGNYTYICYIDDAVYELYPGDKMIVAVYQDYAEYENILFEYGPCISLSFSEEDPIVRYRLEKNTCYTITNKTDAEQTFYFAADINCGEYASANVRADYILEDGKSNMLRIGYDEYIAYLNSVEVILNQHERYILCPRSDYTSNDYIVIYVLKYGQTGDITIAESDLSPIRELKLEIGNQYSITNATNDNIPLYFTGSNVMANIKITENGAVIKDEENYYLSFMAPTEHILAENQVWIITPLTGAVEGNNIVIFVPYTIGETDLIFQRITENHGQ